MPTFKYKAKKGLDRIIESTIDADNEDDVLNKLTAQGLFPVSIEKASSKSPAKNPKFSPGNIKIKFSSSKKITSRDILQFTQKLATLTRAKVELLASLKTLYEQTEKESLKNIILELYNATKEGKTFSQSLENFPQHFSPLFINLIKAGEASGHLDAALEQINDFLRREDSLKTKIAISLAYPALLLLVGLATIFVLINFVIPKLRPIFAGLGDKLPLITKVVLNLSIASQKSWYWIIGVIIGAAIFIYYQKGSSVFKKIGRTLRLNLPVISRLTKNQELNYFSRSLGLLLGSGVSALKSLEIATLTVEDPKLHAQLKKVCQEVASGSKISNSLETLTSLPSFFVKMVAVGEESGRLGEVLDEAARSYMQQIEEDIALISSLIEPVLILGLGLILGTIVLAIMLPTFQVTQLVH